MQDFRKAIRLSLPVLGTYWFLGKYLASAVFGMLIVYCLKDVRFNGGDHGIPELLGILVCVLLHLWRKNMLLTIAGGTIFYMILIQLI